MYTGNNLDRKIDIDVAGKATYKLNLTSIPTLHFFFRKCCWAAIFFVNKVIPMQTVVLVQTKTRDIF